MRKSNKGFTILEVIIAMSILSVVVFVGYGVINGSNNTINSQQVTTNGQLSINLVNKYLTKDLEKSIIDEFDKIKKDENQYSYIMKTEPFKEGNVDNIQYIKYDVKIDEIKTNKYAYTVDRSIYIEEPVDGIKPISNINIISNQPIDNSEKSPLYIVDKYENKNKYLVSLKYEESRGKDKEYKFEVMPRTMIASGNGGELGEIITDDKDDPDLGGKDDSFGNGYIKFSYNSTENNVGMEVGYMDTTTSPATPKPLKEQWGSSSDNIYEFSATVSNNNNNGHVASNIENINKGNQDYFTESKDAFGQMVVDGVNINIIGDAEVIDFDIICEMKDTKCKNKEHTHTDLVYRVGKHEFVVGVIESTNDIGTKGFTVKGKLKKIGESGDVIITFGRIKDTQ